MVASMGRSLQMARGRSAKWREELVDTVLGVSMAPTTVRMVLVEGQNADGATVDEDNFAVAETEDPATFSGARSGGRGDSWHP